LTASVDAAAQRLVPLLLLHAALGRCLYTRFQALLLL
jgi:hypothetical protein